MKHFTTVLSTINRKSVFAFFLLKIAKTAIFLQNKIVKYFLAQNL